MVPPEDIEQELTEIEDQINDLLETDCEIVDFVIPDREPGLNTQIGGENQISSKCLQLDEKMTEISSSSRDALSLSQYPSDSKVLLKEGSKESISDLSGSSVTVLSKNPPENTYSSTNVSVKSPATSEDSLSCEGTPFEFLENNDSCDEFEDITYDKYPELLKISETDEIVSKTTDSALSSGLLLLETAGTSSEQNVMVAAPHEPVVIDLPLTQQQTVGVLLKEMPFDDPVGESEELSRPYDVLEEPERHPIEKITDIGSVCEEPESASQNSEQDSSKLLSSESNMFTDPEKLKLLLKSFPNEVLDQISCEAFKRRYECKGHSMEDSKLDSRSSDDQEKPNPPRRCRDMALNCPRSLFKREKKIKHQPRPNFSVPMPVPAFDIHSHDSDIMACPSYHPERAGSERLYTEGKLRSDLLKCDSNCGSESEENLSKDNGQTAQKLPFNKLKMTKELSNVLTCNASPLDIEACNSSDAEKENVLTVDQTIDFVINTPYFPDMLYKMYTQSLSSGRITGRSDSMFFPSEGKCDAKSGWEEHQPNSQTQTTPPFPVWCHLPVTNDEFPRNHYTPSERKFEGKSSRESDRQTENPPILTGWNNVPVNDARLPRQHLYIPSVWETCQMYNQNNTPPTLTGWSHIPPNNDKLPRQQSYIPASVWGTQQTAPRHNSWAETPPILSGRNYLPVNDNLPQTNSYIPSVWETRQMYNQTFTPPTLTGWSHIPPNNDKLPIQHLYIPCEQNHIAKSGWEADCRTEMPPILSGWSHLPINDPKLPQQQYIPSSVWETQQTVPRHNRWTQTPPILSGQNHLPANDKLPRQTSCNHSSVWETQHTVLRFNSGTETPSIFSGQNHLTVNDKFPRQNLNNTSDSKYNAKLRLETGYWPEAFPGFSGWSRQPVNNGKLPRKRSNITSDSKYNAKLGWEADEIDNRTDTLPGFSGWSRQPVNNGKLPRKRSCHTFQRKSTLEERQTKSKTEAPLTLTDRTNLVYVHDVFPPQVQGNSTEPHRGIPERFVQKIKDTNVTFPGKKINCCTSKSRVSTDSGTSADKIKGKESSAWLVENDMYGSHSTSWDALMFPPKKTEESKSLHKLKLFKDLFALLNKPDFRGTDDKNCIPLHELGWPSDPCFEPNINKQESPPTRSLSINVLRKLFDEFKISFAYKLQGECSKEAASNDPKGEDEKDDLKPLSIKEAIEPQAICSSQVKQILEELFGFISNWEEENNETSDSNCNDQLPESLPVPDVEPASVAKTVYDLEQLYTFDKIGTVEILEPRALYASYDQEPESNISEDDDDTSCSDDCSSNDSEDSYDYPARCSKKRHIDSRLSLRIKKLKLQSEEDGGDNSDDSYHSFNSSEENISSTCSDCDSGLTDESISNLEPDDDRVHNASDCSTADSSCGNPNCSLPNFKSI